MNNFDLWTAVLAGDNTLELRVFSTDDITTAEEQRLTSRLCRLMDLFQEDWRRYKLLLNFNYPIHTFFQREGLFY